MIRRRRSDGLLHTYMQFGSQRSEDRDVDFPVAAEDGGGMRCYYVYHGSVQ